MAHLGADVAAFVDGQLSDPATREALTHLQTCDACAKAVRQQRLLKSRMSTVKAPEPPPELLASLAGLAAAPPARDGWWVRVRRSVPFRAGVVLVSASVAVVMTAYAVGGAEKGVGDEVAPPFNSYAADFFGATAVPAGHVIEDATLDELDGSGWPCLATLGGDLHRVSGAFADHGEVVALSYSNGSAKLNLFEQNGSLDRDSVEGFEHTEMGGSHVWVREGEPMVVTWDDDGVVYTIVTDADRGRVEQAVSQLPRGSHEETPTERVRDGLDRMATWLDAA
ncbi:anti-sigma factor family protein [Aeromicrobium sp.]|uniref:anti-sigma factor family protein n=1 Tax=Aeromicrobium sp. TaxID=1871063 RepID=UPI002FCC5F9E